MSFPSNIKKGCSVNTQDRGKHTGQEYKRLKLSEKYLVEQIVALCYFVVVDFKIQYFLVFDEIRKRKLNLNLKFTISNHPLLDNRQPCTNVLHAYLDPPYSAVDATHSLVLLENPIF